MAEIVLSDHIFWKFSLVGLLAVDRQPYHTQLWGCTIQMARRLSKADI